MFDGMYPDGAVIGFTRPGTQVRVFEYVEPFGIDERTADLVLDQISHTVYPLGMVERYYPELAGRQLCEPGDSYSFLLGRTAVRA